MEIKITMNNNGELKIPKGLKILEIDGDKEFKTRYRTYEGLEIKTQKGYIRFMMDPECQCSEDFDCYFHTPCNTEDYIGSEILGIKKVSKTVENMYKEEDIIEFLIIETNVGTIDYAIYNHHNGFYDHAVILAVLGYEQKYSL